VTTPPEFFVISEVHLRTARELALEAITIARAYPSPLTQGHVHAAAELFDLLVLQRQAEGHAHQQLPLSGAWLQAGDEPA
jgi:hypothetical protein